MPKNALYITNCIILQEPLCREHLSFRQKYSDMEPLYYQKMMVMLSKKEYRDCSVHDCGVRKKRCAICPTCDILKYIWNH